MQNNLSVFSGAAGLDLGLKIVDPEIATVCYIERESAAAACLVSRMHDGALDEAPIWDDIKTFDGRPWRGLVDIISGGYPCQGESTAGKRQGNKDPRWLWPDLKRVIGEVEPEICFFENVANHLNMGFFEVATDLQAMGYSIAAGLFSAEETGASHERLRLFILAHRIRSGSNSRPERAGREKRPDISGCCERAKLGDTDSGDQQRSWSGQTDQGLAVTGSSGNVADTLRNGAGEEPREPSEGSGPSTIRAGRRKRAQSCNDSENMVDTDSHNGWTEQQPREQARDRRGELTGASEGLAHTSGAGLQGREQRGPSGERDWEAAHGSASELCRARLPLFAPGPGDFEAWARILEIDPGLKPSLCRDADGMAGRVDRLRICGNGVSPLAAAYAYRTLTDALREYAAGQ